jgi:hypothetical protein
MNEPRQPGIHPSQTGHPHAAQPHHPATPMHPQHAHPAQPLHPQPHRPALTPTAPGGRPHIAAPPTMKPQHDDLDPIELIEEPTTAAPPLAKKIRTLGADGHRQHHEWKRQLNTTGQGASRVRSFHGKYSEQGLEYLDNAINEWLDVHPEVEVKFVTSTVMTFEGKIREPALVLNLWY